MLPRKSLYRTLLMLALAPSAAAAQERSATPGRDAPERRAIVEALRAPVQKELKKKVVFKVDHLKTQGGWAFLRGVPRRPDGGALDYRDTVYAQAIADGVFDDWICALLRKDGAGRWRVVTFVIGATDVAYEGWDEEYRAPAAIFR